MSEFWLCFNCCIAEQPQPKRRRRIDRSMIGEPTNFVHTAHVGSGDLFSGMNSVSMWVGHADEALGCGHVSPCDSYMFLMTALGAVNYRQRLYILSVSIKEEKMSKEK
uniref:CDC42 small effector protein 2 n=1 Tax=Sus scrofa TaxID=9823 RepID=A0A4X1ULK2_PIG